MTTGPVLVAGGGIGGLAAATAIAQAGHRVVVLERRAEFTELGAGIQLAPNAFTALDHLGVGEAVRRDAVYVDDLRFMDGLTGQRLAALPLTGRYRERFRNPYVVVHRNDLYQPLLAACRAYRAIELRTCCHVVGYRQDAASVTALLSDGRQVTGPMLIGADGIRSAVREQLLGDGEPRVSGHTIFRSVVPMERVPERLRWNAVTLWAGPGWHFVHYPIGGGRQMNMAITRDDDAQVVVSGAPVERAKVVDGFPDLAEAARELLQHGADWRTWVLCDRDPAPRWTDGRVTLLGDAAHPMLQYAAQGACQALEDAVLLGRMLDQIDETVPNRLRRYEAARIERTARITMLARAMGDRLYHPAGEEALDRNVRLSALTEDDLHREVTWLHGPGHEVFDGGGTVLAGPPGPVIRPCFKRSETVELNRR